jgi:hypothetical protein
MKNNLVSDSIEGVNQVVRPIVTLTLTAGITWGFIYEKVSAEAYLGLVAVVVGFWFRERQEKADVKADVKEEVARAVEPSK